MFCLDKEVILQIPLNVSEARNANVIAGVATAVITIALVLIVIYDLKALIMSLSRLKINIRLVFLKQTKIG